jgi:hypothetical protein
VLFQLELFQEELFQLDESQFAVEFQLVEFQLEEFQLELFQDELFQLDEFQSDAIVESVRQAPPGAQTRAGTPWFARLGVEEKSYTGPRLSDATVVFFGFGPGLAVSSHLTLSGLHVGCS